MGKDATAGPAVLHVLPKDLARGAQRYARSLRDALDGPSVQHRILTLFGDDAGIVDADIRLGLPPPSHGWDLRPAVGLRKALRRQSPALVIAHGGESLKYVVATGHRGPIIYYRIGIAPESSWKGPQGLLQRALLKRPAVVVGVSRAAAQDVIENASVPTTKVRVIPNGRDPEIYHPADSGSTRAEPTVGFVGHLTRTKRPDLFVDAVKALSDRGIAVRSYIAGSGPLANSVCGSAEPAGIACLGSRNDVPELLREADIFLFTSIPEGEGMPGVLIEAGLTGLPTVSTDVPGARDVIVDGETGFVVDPDDRQALFNAVARLCESPELRQRMGLGARERCASHFSLDASTQAWAQLVSDYLPREGRR